MIQLADGAVCIGNNTSQIEIWDVSSGTCVKTLTGHSGPVVCVSQLADGRMCSGSYDKTIKIWE